MSVGSFEVLCNSCHREIPRSEISTFYFLILDFKTHFEGSISYLGT